MARDVIIALDFSDAAQTLSFLERFKYARPYVKVGMELFYAEGPGFIRTLKNRGHRIFLDLKLHDIPNTVRGGMRSLLGLGADMLNLHAAGGSAMMRAALEGIGGAGERPILLAVTQLTSTSADTLKNELLISTPMTETVLRYAKNAADSGLDGVVCSPLEATAVKLACGAKFLTVTPGIRFAGAELNDQSRVTTPEAARKNGSDYIVVGRPITGSDDPESAYERCIGEFLGGDE